MKLIIKQSIDKLPKGAYVFCSKKSDYSSIPSRLRVLQSLRSKDRLAYIAYQTNMVQNFRKSNERNHVFLSTPLACENIWQSDFFTGLENLFQLKAILRKEKTIYLYCQSDFWTNIIESEMKKLGVSVQKEPRQKCSSQPYLLFQRNTSSIYLAAQSLKYILNLLAPWKLPLKKRIPSGDIVFFSTWFQKTVHSYAKNKKDPFFSNIPSMLQEEKKKVFLFSHIEDFSKQNTKKLNREIGDNCYTYFNFLNFFDLISIFSKIYFSHVKIPRAYKPFKKVIRKECNVTKWCQSLHALMVKSVTSKIIHKSPNIKVIHTFEGNCWEKGIGMAREESASKFHGQIYGYQHTGVSESFQKMKAPQKYFPDVVISTGKAATSALENTFLHNREQIFTSCHLRSSKHISFKKKSLPKEIKNVLLLLQGAPTDRLFLKKVEFLLKNNELKITVRCHPAAPMDALDIPNSFSISDRELISDLMEHDAVLHNGTSAALEAAACGVPSLYIDLGFSYSSNNMIDINDNVLFQSINEKKTIKQAFSSIVDSNNSFSEYLSNISSCYNAFFKQPTLQQKKKLVNFLRAE